MELILDGSRYMVQGRVAIIIMWLLHRLDRISVPDKVQIVFDCAGPDLITVEIKERERVDLAHQ